VIIQGHAFTELQKLPSASVNTCVTSPPYWGLRDYGVEGQLGLEATPEEYVAGLVVIFAEVRRVLKDDGTLWLNLGDSYSRLGGKAAGGNRKAMYLDGKQSRLCKPPQGLKEKDLVGIPWRVAFALQADGWYLRQDIIWHKPNPMPESVTDRCTKAHEYFFLLSKLPQYYFNHEAIKEPAKFVNSSRPHVIAEKSRKSLRTDIESRHRSAIKGGQTLQKNPDGKRNRRSVWTVTTKPFKGAHFATFPPDLIEPCILAGSPEGGVVLDPFFGAGTTGLVAKKHNRNYIGIELNSEYIKLAQERLAA
jgi:DNA modification methylase